MSELGIVKGKDKTPCVIVRKAYAGDDTIWRYNDSHETQEKQKGNYLLGDVHSTNDPHLTWYFDYTYQDNSIKEIFGEDFSIYNSVRTPYPTGRLNWNLDPTKYEHSSVTSLKLEKESYIKYTDYLWQHTSAEWIDRRHENWDKEFVEQEHPSDNLYGIVSDEGKYVVIGSDDGINFYRNDYPTGRISLKLYEYNPYESVSRTGNSDFHVEDSTSGQLSITPIKGQPTDIHHADTLSQRDWNKIYLNHPNVSKVKMGIEYVVSAANLDYYVNTVPKYDTDRWDGDNTQGPFNWLAVVTKGIGGFGGAYTQSNTLESSGYAKFYNLTDDKEHVRKIGTNTYLIHDDDYYVLDSSDTRDGRSAIGNQFIGMYAPKIPLRYCYQNKTAIKRINKETGELHYVGWYLNPNHQEGEKWHLVNCPPLAEDWKEYDWYAYRFNDHADAASYLAACDDTYHVLDWDTYDYVIDDNTDADEWSYGTYRRLIDTMIDPTIRIMARNIKFRPVTE